MKRRSDIGWFRGLQVSAMRAVAASQPEFDGKLDIDGDYHLRRIFRWYSKNFATPLHEVYELPLEDVLTHYWESQYEDMEADEREHVIKRLVETEEERALREMKNAADADADEAWLRRVEQQEKERLAKKEETPVAKPAVKPPPQAGDLPPSSNKPIEGFTVNFVNDPKEIEDLMKKWDEG
jgi:hypothetical protein